MSDVFGIKGDIEEFEKAIKVLDTVTDEALKYMEWWFIGKKDIIAEHINNTVRDEIQHIIDEARKINKTSI